MTFNYDLIKKTYGETVAEEIELLEDMVIENIKYLMKLKFRDVEDIFYRFAVIFLYDEDEFKEKVNGLIKSIGKDYVKVLEGNMDLWCTLL